MSDDEWLEQQQRAHNLRSFGIELPPMKPIRPKRHIFTVTELLVADRWAEKQKVGTA